MARKPLKALHPRHHEAIRLKLKGVQQTKIAELLDVEFPTVSNWFSEPIVQAEMKRRQDTAIADAQKILTASARSAARYLSAASDIDDPEHAKTQATGVRAAGSVLDRVGLPAAGPQESEPEEDMDLEQIRTLLRSLPRGLIREVLGEE